MSTTATIKRPVPQVTMMARYDPDTADRLGRALTGMGMPSLGPGIGVSIVGLAEALGNFIETNPASADAGVANVLAEYRAKLLDIAFVDAAAQAAVIEKLRKLTGEGTP